MEEYIKNINGLDYIKLQKDIIIYKNGKQIINPSKQLLLEDGWNVYIQEQISTWPN